MAYKRVAVVTGGNRGMASRLSSAGGARVVLSPRATRRRAGPRRKSWWARAWKVLFHPLDLKTRRSSGVSPPILGDEIHGTDILVNNAGVFLDQKRGGLDVPMHAVRDTLETNVLGAWRPASSSSRRCASALRADRQRLHRPGGDVRDGRRLFRLSGLQGSVERSHPHPRRRAARHQPPGQRHVPGLGEDRHGRPERPVPVEKGADTAVWLATLPDGGPTGGFFRDRRPIPW